MSAEQPCQSACSLSELILMLGLVLPMLIQESGTSLCQTFSADSSVTSRRCGLATISEGRKYGGLPLPPLAIDLVTDSKFTAVLTHKMFHLLLKDQ